MDNRRLFGSYQTKVKNSTKIYPISSDGIISKVKRLFSPAPSAKSNTVDVPFKFAPAKPDGSLDASYGNSSSTTPLKIPGSFEVHTSPNNRLSSFFQKKGDDPLNEIEYEGVLSLMAKPGTPNTNKKRKSDEGSFEQNESTVYLPKRLKENNLLIATPQRRLRNSTYNDDISNISIPEYQPVYHTFTNDGNSVRKMHSVRRVYQFSGLPLPYRTRIRAPSLTKTKQRSSNLSNVSFDVTLMGSHDKTNPRDQRPISEAANTLLNILDGHNERDPKNDDGQSNIKLFSNPYASIKTKRKAEKPSITATDINKTISFDKSKSLPLADTARKPKETNLSIENVQKFPESSFNFQLPSNEANTPGNFGTNFKTQFEKTKFEQSQIKSHENTELTSSSHALKPEIFGYTSPTATNEESREKIGKPKEHEQSFKTNDFDEYSTFKSGTSSFSQPHAREKASSCDNFEEGSSLIAREHFTFDFPSVEITNVILDSSRVAQYRLLYEFIV